MQKSVLIFIPKNCKEWGLETHLIIAASVYFKGFIYT